MELNTQQRMQWLLQTDKIDFNVKGKAVIYGTDDISFFNNLDFNDDLSYDKGFEGKVSAAGGKVDRLYENGNESGDFEKKLSETKSCKYVFVLFNAWPETNITTVNAGVSNGTDGSVATSFVTVVSGDGTTFNTIQWNVKSGSKEKTSDEISIGDITLGNGSKAVFGLIVDGLNDAEASAEAAVK